MEQIHNRGFVPHVRADAPWHMLQRALQSTDQHSQGSFKMQPPSATTPMIASPLDVEPQPHIMHPLEDYLRST